MLLHRQNVLGVMERVDDVLITTCNGKERPRMGDDDERQTVVEYVEHVLFLNLSQMHVLYA